MGISGLLQFPPVKQVTVQELRSNFSGKTAAVDVSGWIHKALSITAFGDYDRVRLGLYFGCSYIEKGPNGDQNGDTVEIKCKESNYEVDTSCCLACHVSWHNRLTDEAPFCADGIMYGEL